MTKFNPNNQETLTYGEALSPAMEITDQSDADQYKEAYINWQMGRGVTHERATEIVNINLGYFAGYYSNETRLRIESLFKTQHPYFGKAANGIPSAKEAFEIGLKLGEQKK